MKLGADIRDARLRRGLPAAIIAERAGVSRPTLTKVERGSPSVGIGIYFAVLQALNLLKGVELLADAKNDPEGLQIAMDRLPKRASLKHLRPRIRPLD